MTSEPRPEHRDERFATPQEARDAIEGLLEADYAKLMLIAKGFVKERLQDSLVEPDDLVQEAITKTLGNRRRWNRSVSIIKHLDRVMESDAGHEAERRAVSDLRLLPEDDETEPAAQQPGPEARLAALDEIEGLLALFLDDHTALGLLHLKGNDLSASEIQQALGIGKTEYDTITKRIRRRLAKHITEGGK